MSSIIYLQDDFTNNSFDTAKWVESTNAGSLVAEQNDRLEIISNASISGFIRSVNKWSMQNKQLIVKVSQHCTDGGFKLCPTIVVDHQWDVYSELNWYNFQLSSGPVLSPNVKDAGAAAQVGGDSATLTPPYWMRIRVSATTIYFDVADQNDKPTTEGEWTNISSETWDMGTGITQEQYIYLTSYNTPTTGESHWNYFELKDYPFFTTKTVTSKASIKLTEAQTLTAKANIKTTKNQTLTSAGYIIDNKRRISARARIRYQPLSQDDPILAHTSDEVTAHWSGLQLVRLSNGSLVHLYERSYGNGGISYVYAAPPYKEWSDPISIDDNRDYSTVDLKRVVAKVDSEDNIHILYGQHYYRKLTFDWETHTFSIGNELSVDMPSATEYYGVASNLDIDSNDRVYLTIAYNTGVEPDTDTIGASYIDPPHTSVTYDGTIDTYASGEGPGAYGEGLVHIGTTMYLFQSWGVSGHADLVLWKRDGSWGARQTVYTEISSDAWETDAVVIDKNNQFHFAITDGGYDVYYGRGIEGNWEAMETLLEGAPLWPHHLNMFLEPNGEDVNIVAKCVKGNAQHYVLLKRKNGTWENKLYEVNPDTWQRPPDGVLLYASNLTPGKAWHDATGEMADEDTDYLIHPITERTFTQAGDILYVGHKDLFHMISYQGSLGAGSTTWAYEYWDGDSWKAFTPTNPPIFTAGNLIANLWADRDSIPEDWELKTIDEIGVMNRGPMYWVRFRLVSAALSETIRDSDLKLVYGNNRWVGVVRNDLSESQSFPRVILWNTTDYHSEAVLVNRRSNYYLTSLDSLEDTPIYCMYARGYIVSKIQTITAKGYIGTGIVEMTQTVETLGRIQHTRTQTIEAKGLIQIVSTQTITSLARIQKSSSQTLEAKGRIQLGRTQTINSLARMQNEFSQTLTAKADIIIWGEWSDEWEFTLSETLTKTIEALASIKKVTTQTIEALGRIQTSSQQTIDTLGRITVAGGVGNLISAKAAIKVSQEKTIEAKATIKKSINQTVDTLGRITTITSQTIDALGRITVTETQTVEAKGRITQVFEQTIEAVGRIKKSSTQNISALGRITKQADNTIAAKARITAPSTQSLTSKGRIKKQFSQSINAKGRIAITTSQTVSAKTSIKKLATQTIEAKATILKTFAQTISALARITITPSQTVDVKANIVATQQHTIQVKGIIGVPFGQTIDAKADIKTTQTKTISVKAVIGRTFEQTINALGRIQIVPEQSITTKGNIVATQIKTIDAKGRITITSGKTIFAKASVKEITIQTLTTKGRIQITFQQSITAKARIEKVAEKTISAKGRIGIAEIAQTVDAKASIKETLEKTLETLGRIQITSTQQINVKGRITRTGSAIVDSKARITIASQQTIATKARIGITSEKTISAKARIGIIVEKTIQTKASIIKLGIRTISAKATIATYRVVDIIDNVRDQKLVEELTYVKETTKEISYTKVEVSDIIDDRLKVKDVPRTRPVIVEITDSNRVNQIRWLTVKARIRR